MTELILALTLGFVIYLIIAIVAGVIFRIIFKTVNPNLLALLSGVVLFLPCGATLGALIAVSPSLVFLQVIIPIIISSILAKIGIDLVDRKRNKNPNQSSDPT